MPPEKKHLWRKTNQSCQLSYFIKSTGYLMPFSRSVIPVVVHSKWEKMRMMQKIREHNIVMIHYDRIHNPLKFFVNIPKQFTISVVQNFVRSNERNNSKHRKAKAAKQTGWNMLCKAATIKRRAYLQRKTMRMRTTMRRSPVRMVRAVTTFR